MEGIIISDLERFSKSRSWFRTLPLQGRKFLVFPWKGQQPYNPFTPNVEDSEGLHWWVWEADYIDEIPIHGIGKDIIMRRPVIFNCFLRGIDGEPDHPHLRGLDVIRTNNPGFEVSNYTKHAKKEHKRQIKEAVKTVVNIYYAMMVGAPEWLKEEEVPESHSESHLESPYWTRPKVRRTKSDFSLESPKIRNKKFSART